MPNVETMEITLPNIHNENDQVASSVRNSGLCATKLKALIIHRALVKPSALDIVLGLTPNLTSLTCELMYLIGEHWIHNDGSEQIDGYRVWKALSRLEGSLESLTIFKIPFQPNDRQWMYQRPAISLGFGSFRRFKRFQRLDVPLVMLTGCEAPRYQDLDLVDCLPTSISHLALSISDSWSSYDNWIVHNFSSQIQEFLRQSRDLGSSLQSITLKMGEHGSPQRHLVGTAEMAADCEWHGVAFRVIHSMPSTRYSHGEDMVREETFCDPLEPAPGPTVSYKRRTFLERSPYPVKIGRVE